MNDEQQELLNLVNNAISNFNAKEKYLLDKNLSERCICSKFAQYLNNEMKKSINYIGYDVDVEYNRGAKGNEYEPKRLSEEDGVIVVDLIAHKRGYDEVYGFDNLICIEMKKTTDRRGCSSDENRLKIMTSQSSQFCYKLGIMLLANIKEKKLIIKSTFPQ